MGYITWGAGSGGVHVRVLGGPVEHVGVRVCFLGVHLDRVVPGAVGAQSRPVHFLPVVFALFGDAARVMGKRNLVASTRHDESRIGMLLEFTSG